MKLIIFEGPDNTGKSTIINNLTTKLNNYKVFHFIAPNQTPVSENEIVCNKENCIQFAKDIREKYVHKYDYVILDRSWYSEYVYGQKYRNREEEEVVAEIINIEEILNASNSFDFEKDSYLFILKANSDFLANNEDGVSLSKGKKSSIKEEIKMFTTLCSYTGTAHTRYLNVTNKETGTFHTFEYLIHEILTDIEK